MKETFLDLGFVAGKFEPCIFRHTTREIALLAYVDDVLICGASTDSTWFVDSISDKFEITRSDLSDFLGFEIKKEPDCITLSARKYIEKTLSELKFVDAKIVATTALQKRYFTPAASDSDRCTEPFNVFLGKLLWVNKMRPDVNFATGLLSRVAHAPTLEAWQALKRVFRYLKGTLDYTLRFTEMSDLTHLTAYSDASFAEDPSFKSHGGCVILRDNTNVVQHYSRVQTTVSTSTAESELTELVRTAKEVQFVVGVYEDLNVLIDKVTIFVDAQVVLDVVSGDTLLRRTKHLGTKIAYLRELRDFYGYLFDKIPTEHNLADIMTKQMPKPQFVFLRDLLMNGHATSPMTFTDMNLPRRPVRNSPTKLRSRPTKKRAQARPSADPKGRKTVRARRAADKLTKLKSSFKQEKLVGRNNKTLKFSPKTRPQSFPKKKKTKTLREDYIY